MQSRNVDEMQAMSEWLPTHQPQQILPPGNKSAYSNYGITLAAYIVELQTGMPYNEYVKKIS